MATEQKHYSESVLGVENKVSRDVLKINYLGPQRTKKEKKKKISSEKKSLQIQYAHSVYIFFYLNLSFLIL